MSRRFVELVVRARRLVTRAPAHPHADPARARVTGRRQVGGELTQFSFRLAFMIDVAYVGVGALGGAAISRASVSDAPATSPPAAASCRPDTSAAPAPIDTLSTPNGVPLIAPARVVDRHDTVVDVLGV
jgi:hypothetical protein